MLNSYWVNQPVNLDNCTTTANIVSQTEDDTMSFKINRAVVINGKKTWIRANTEQDYINKVLSIHMQDHTLETRSNTCNKHDFSDYALNWFNTFSKPNIATVTAETYMRQISNRLIPAFENMYIEDITIDDVQRLFNDMNCKKATKDKVKIVLNQIFDAALEDGYINKNPLKSKRLKIVGGASETTRTYTTEQMQYLINHINDIENDQDKVYLVLAALHPLRLEEVLGLQKQDIDISNKRIHVNCAVTHPTRNEPEIKQTKTTSSVREIGLVSFAIDFLKLLDYQNESDFIIGGQNPLSYTQVRRMCNRIGKQTKFTETFNEKITPSRFRTTVLTDIFNQTKDIKLTQKVAGHTTSAMTLKHYVKNREDVDTASKSIEMLYTA